MERRVRSLNEGSHLADEALAQTLGKWVTADQLRHRLLRLTDVWPHLRDRLSAQLLPASELQRMLADVGAPTHPDDIGLDWHAFRATYSRAQTIRKRYTVLDLALEANLLDELVAELFADDGFWGRQR